MSPPRHRRAEHAAWRDLGDETVLVDLAAKEMYGLNPAAGWVWQALDGSVGLRELAERLGESGAVGLADLERFCSELAELGLLAVVDGEVAAPAAEAAAPPPAPAETLEPPAIRWREPIRQAAGTCAFMPLQSPLCNQAPFT